MNNLKPGVYEYDVVADFEGEELHSLDIPKVRFVCHKQLHFKNVVFDVYLTDDDKLVVRCTDEHLTIEPRGNNEVHIDVKENL